MTRKVLLVTTVDWVSTARYAGGFAAASWTVDALSPRRAPVRLSRYVDTNHTYHPLCALASLRTAISKAQPDLLVPCDDRAAGQLVRLYRKESVRGTESPIASLIRRSLGSPENIDAIMSRAGSMSATAEIGVRTPETVLVANEEDLDACLSRIGFPAVLKLDGSWGGDGVIVARSREDAVGAFRRLSKPASRLRNVARAFRRRDGHFVLDAVVPPKHIVSVQKFIPGRPAASAFACWQGEIVAEIHYDVLIAEGTIGPPVVIRRVDCAQMTEASRRIARHYGLSGLYGLDFIRDDAGLVHLLEINPRTTQGGTLPFGEGRDLPSALAACVMQCAATRRDAIGNDVVAFFPGEWQRDMASPHLTSGYHNVPWDDPAVLKHCFDTLPEAASPARKAAIERLLAAAPERREIIQPRRAFASNQICSGLN
jgi:predicted ATP-grasp superfamily ATP-dependent carboligase